MKRQNITENDGKIKYKGLIYEPVFNPFEPGKIFQLIFLCPECGEYTEHGIYDNPQCPIGLVVCTECGKAHQEQS